MPVWSLRPNSASLTSRLHRFVPLLWLSSNACCFLASSFQTPRQVLPSVPRHAAVVPSSHSPHSCLQSTADDTAMTTHSTTLPLNDDGSPRLPALPTTSKRLFLVRHGEVINPGGDDKIVFYGGADVPLSPLGQLEAQAAASYLKQFPLQRIFSSPLSRALYGAEQVKLQTPSLSDVDVVVLDGLSELNRGDWCGLTKDEIGTDLLARFDACDESVTPGGGGESYPALKRRVLAALHTALNLMEPGTMACLVSHLQVTRSILSEALHIPITEMVHLKVATASVTCIDYDGESQLVQFQSFKPNAGLRASKDGAN